MAVAIFNLTSQYLRCNTEITVVLPERPFSVDAEAFYASGKRFKVLWLLHGGMGDSTDWLRKSNIEVYAAENDLLTVMPSAYNSSYANWESYSGGMLMTDYFFDELMPFVHNWLPASDLREDNYIAGMSMGGQGSLKYTLMHPERFAGSAMLSSRAEEYPGYYEKQLHGKKNMTVNLVHDHGGIDSFMKSDENIRERMREIVANGGLGKLPPIFHAIGTADRHYGEYLEFKRFCEEIRFDRISFHETEGYGHEWRYWDYAIRAALREFGFTCPD